MCVMRLAPGALEMNNWYFLCLHGGEGEPSGDKETCPARHIEILCRGNNHGVLLTNVYSFWAW